MLTSKTESATSARKAFFKILDEVTQDSSVVIVKRKDAPNAAIIAESELNSLLETVHLLRSPKNAKRFFQALERSYTRNLDSLDPEESDPENVLNNLRQYCEQEKEANTVEVIPDQES